jgi:hypothetical protein
MSQHANRVQMTVTGTPGTGTITLNAATSGYQSFGTAYSSADATVDILITEGTSWEVARNCTYTHSGTTVTRGTLESSSSGSAVSFTSAAIVSVIATAASGNNWGLNEIDAAVTGSPVTGVVGTMHILDLAGLTADRDFVLPATCAVGDRIGVMVEVGDADHELLLKPDGADTINGGSAGAEWSRVFITGEVVIFRCVTANSAWIVEYDGRIPQRCVLRLSTSVTTNTANTILLPTNTGGAWTADVNVGDIGTTTNGRITVRRANDYSVQASAISNAGITDQNHYGCGVFKNTESDTNSLVNIGRFFASASSALVLNSEMPSLVVPLAASDYLVYFYRSQEANKGLGAYSAPRLSSAFSVVEIL